MKIIQAEPNPTGDFPPINDWPGNTPPDGYCEITCDTSEFFNGYVKRTIVDGKVTAIEENVELHKAWTDEEAAKPKPTPAPETTTDELSDAMCGMDAAIDTRLSAVEDALCDLDSAANGGETT